MDREHLTVSQVADQLGKHPDTIRRYIQAGRLLAVRWRGRWWINPASIEWMNEGMTPKQIETRRQLEYLLLPAAARRRHDAANRIN